MSVIMDWIWVVIALGLGVVLVLVAAIVRLAFLIRRLVRHARHRAALRRMYSPRYSSKQSSSKIRRLRHGR